MSLGDISAKSMMIKKTNRMKAGIVKETNVCGGRRQAGHIVQSEETKYCNAKRRSNGKIQ